MVFIIATGFVGAFTTFSTFMFETDSLFFKGSGLTATLNVIASAAIVLLAARLGVVIALRM